MAEKTSSKKTNTALVVTAIILILVIAIGAIYFLMRPSAPAGPKKMTF